MFDPDFDPDFDSDFDSDFDKDAGTEEYGTRHRRAPTNLVCDIAGTLSVRAACPRKAWERDKSLL